MKKHFDVLAEWGFGSADDVPGWLLLSQDEIDVIFADAMKTGSVTLNTDLNRYLEYATPRNNLGKIGADDTVKKLVAMLPPAVAAQRLITLQPSMASRARRARADPVAGRQPE